MTSSIFTNSIQINASQERILQALTEIPEILRWDKEIVSIKPQEGGAYLVKRNASAYVQEELVHIDQEAGAVLYKASSPELNYQIDWKLETAEEGGQKLSQELLIDEKLNPLMLAVAKTVTKAAFQKMLRSLKRTVEV